MSNLAHPAPFVNPWEQILPSSAPVRPYPNRTPSGVDFEAAKHLGRTVIWALSLPGKVAPVTAGAAVKMTIYHMLHERGC